MNFFADECVYQVTVEVLRSWGHDVITAQEVGLAGKPDEGILAFAVEQNRILLTIDLDFSNIRRYPPGSYAGIVVLKIRPRFLNDVHAVLRQMLGGTDSQQLGQSLVIVDRNKYRVR